VAQAIGASTLQKDFKFLTFGPPSSAGATAAAKLYNKWIAKVPHFQSFFLNQPYLMALWDTVNMMALAMLEAHSVNPTVYNAYVAKVGMPGRGAVVVHGFAAGKAALARGKRIQYVGGIGPTIYNKYHNSAGGFLAYDSALNPTSGIVPSTVVTNLLTKYGG
jgi:hypothetical protein